MTLRALHLGRELELGKAELFELCFAAGVQIHSLATPLTTSQAEQIRDLHARHLGDLRRRPGRWADGPRADVLARDHGWIRFAVDPVIPAAEALPTTSTSSLLQRRFGAAPLSSAVEGDALVECTDLNPLVATVHRAFAEHRPLALRPDDIWLTLVQGFVSHVDRNAETLRERFVQFDGKQTLRVNTTAVSTSAIDDWPAILDAFTREIAEHVGDGRRRLLLVDYSTTTPVTRTAGAISMLAAFKKYFDYEVACVCGIPSVTLCGTPDDWRALATRARCFAEYGLEEWVRLLQPILDALIQSAEGQPSLGFWQAICKPEEAYGGDVLTGWVGLLFPYITGSSGQPTMPNPMLRATRRGLWVHTSEGLHPSDFPPGLSECGIDVIAVDGSRERVRLIGGLMGTRQNADGVLSVAAGWVALVAGRDAHHLQRLAEVCTQSSPAEPYFMTAMPAALRALLQAASGTLWATSAHPWHITGPVQPETLKTVEQLPSDSFLSDSYSPLTRFGHLVDGRALMAIKVDSVWRVVVGHLEPHLHDEIDYGVRILSDATVIATDVSDFMARIIAADGDYYFDAPDFEPPAKLESNP